MEKLRILVADDHEIVRQGVKNLIESEPDWELCGEATTGRDAVKLVETLEPDIAIIDLSMPDLNGLEATRHIRKLGKKTKVLIFSGHETERLVREVFDAGAFAYVLKSDAGKSLITAIRTISEGSHFFSSKVNEVIFEGFLKASAGEKNEGSDAILPTAREREIIQLLAEGCSNKEVAAKLGISLKTAETHRSSIMRKLSLGSLSDLVRYAIRNGFVEP